MTRAAGTRGVERRVRNDRAEPRAQRAAALEAGNLATFPQVRDDFVGDVGARRLRQDAPGEIADERAKPRHTLRPRRLVSRGACGREVQIVQAEARRVVARYRVAIGV